MKISRESVIDHNLGSGEFPTPDAYGHMWRKGYEKHKEICVKCGLIKDYFDVIRNFCDYDIEES